MKTPFIVAGLVLLVVASVVDAQASCTSDSCVVGVENARTVLQQNITARSISLEKCGNVTATITMSIIGCRNIWTANSCPNATIAPLDARLTNVTNYLKTACSVQQDCNTTQLAAVQSALSVCQPKTFNALNISGVNSQTTICRTVQTTLDCITNAAAPCLSSLSTVVSFQTLYNIYLGLWFDCSMTVGNTAVVNTFTAVCSYPTLAKCYNPLLQKLGKQTIDNNFDYYYLNSRTGLGVDDLLSYSNQAKYCGMIGTNFNWNSLKSCVQAASANCGEALGESASIPLGDLESIWDNLFVQVSVNLKSLELLADMCGTGCNNIASRSTALSACLNPVAAATAIVANYTKSDITAACRTLNQSVSCMNNVVTGCKLLREDIYYNYFAGGNQITIQTAAYVCGLSFDAALPWEVCRNKQAAREAGNIELRCATTGLMLKNNLGTGQPSPDFVSTSISIMMQCSQLSCWQNEATYITPLLPFAAVMQAVYNSSVVPKLGGVPAVALKGANCDIQGYMNCFNPLLTALGARFATPISQLYPVSAMLTGVAADVQQYCDNLTAINWDAMISCAEGRWSQTCSTPSILLKGSTTSTLGRGVNKFYLTDLRAMKKWVMSICMINCTGVQFGISAQQIIQCAYQGGSSSRILDQSRLALLASFLGQPIDGYCKNLSDATNCLITISYGCAYLDSVREQLTGSPQYTVAMQMCFPNVATTVTTTLAGPSVGSTQPGNTNSNGGSGSSTSGGGNSQSTTTKGGTGGQTNGGDRRVNHLSLIGFMIGFVMSSLLARI